MTAEAVIYQRRVKSAAEVLIDQTFWDEQRAAWRDALEADARKIFDAGVTFARETKPQRRRRSAVKALVDVLFRRKARDFLDPVEDVLDNIAGNTFETYMDDWWAQLERTTRDALRQAIIDAAADGSGTRGVIDRIEPMFGEIRARRIGVTETTRLFGRGAIATYQASGIEMWVWQTSEDDHVCPECDDLDGQEFPINDIFDPAHVGCRCFPLAVVE
jgi:SPP1 gp7 family putative phage head morphogenesis protein